MGEHTKTPWTLTGSIKSVAGEDGRADDLWCGAIMPPRSDKYRGDICHLQSVDHITHGITRTEAAANAAFIVTACNAHDDLVLALELARKRIEYFGGLMADRHEDANKRDFYPIIDAALAKAKP